MGFTLTQKRERSVKVKVTINLEDFERERAKKLGLNISQICTNALKTCNDAVETALGKPLLNPCSSAEENGLVRSPRFEPGSSAWQGSADDVERWRLFVEAQKWKGTYPRTIFNLGLKYADDLFKRDLSKVRDVPKSNRGNVLKALANLAKCFGVYADYPGLLKAFGVEWAGRAKNQIFAGRLESVHDVWGWVRSVKEADRGLADFMDLISVSGLRVVEAVNSFNLIGNIAKSEGLKLVLSGDRKRRVSGYYNFDNECLEHFWFNDLFLRETKNVFLSFVPTDLVKRISESKPVPPAAALTKFCINKVGHSELKLIRKAQGTLMLNYLKREEIDLLQGRVTGDIFMANYFTPSLGDLKTRTFQGITAIQTKIKMS